MNELQTPSVVYADQGFRWPNGSNLAVWVVLNVEHFNVNKPIPGVSNSTPNSLGFSVREYGSRVGFYRVADLLDELDVRVSVALNSAVCERFPRIIERIVRSDWEVLGHNITNSQRLVELDAAAESEHINSALETIQQHTSSRPRGWLSAGLQESKDTLRLLSSAGVDYVCDWILEDQPVLLQQGDTSIYAVPYSVEIADKKVFEQEGNPADEFVSRAIRQFDSLLEEGKNAPRAMAISLHPYLIGQPHRIEALRRVLDYIQRSTGAWITTGADILDAFMPALPHPKESPTTGEAV